MRMLKISAMGLLLLLLWTNIATGGTRDPDTADARYVEFGKKFPCVVKIKAEVGIQQLIVNGIVVSANDDPNKPRPKFVQHASAVIIQPHWILTAAHVIEDTVAQTVESDGREFPIEFVVPHPEYRTENYGYYDIALGYSPQDFALEFYTPLYETPDEISKTATIAGFGWHGTFHTGSSSYDGKRRAGSNVVTELERGVLVCDASQQNKTALEFLICPGDSGGGLFIGNQLAGINSFLIAVDKKPNGTYSDKAAFTRVSLYKDWVKSEIAKRGRRGLDAQSDGK